MPWPNTKPTAWIALVLLLAVVTADAAGAPELRRRTVEERVLEQLDGQRETVDVQPFERSEVLDDLARERAETIARLPDEQRLADPWKLGDALAGAGVHRWRNVYPRLAVLQGSDIVDRIVAQWRGLPQAWAHVLDPAAGQIGLGGAWASDGSYVFVSIVLEPLPTVPTREQLERAVFDRVNDIRDEHGLPRLDGNEALTTVARKHSDAMAREGFFDHVDPRGDGPKERMRGSGVRYRRVAENLAYNHRVADPVDNAIRSWLDSEGHRANIMDGTFRSTGVGITVADDGRVWFTQLFVEPLDLVSAAEEP